MPPGNLAAADGLAAARVWLLSHPAVTAALGGPDRVGPRNVPPYPRLLLTDGPGGSDRNLRWLIAPLITVAALGDLDGTPGKAELRRILYVALTALAELPDFPTAPGAPVVTQVESAAGVGWSPEPTGQPRYIASVRVFIHPPQGVPA
jgi:hypothetical protein